MDVPKVSCPCGHQFNLSTTEASEVSIVRERNIESLIVAADHGAIDVDRIIEILDHESKAALICPCCERILVRRKNSAFYDTYSKEV